MRRCSTNPRRPVAASELAAIADADARENWSLMIAFRDRLVANRTLEAGYLDLVRRGVGATPPLFINQLVHVILRNVLDGCEDVFVLRAAELFFRPQRLTVHDGSLIAADEETITGMHAEPVSPLVAMLGLPAAGEIDVVNDDNAESYWQRSDLFDMALDLTAGRRGLAALGEVIERWITHLLAVEVEVEPLKAATDVDLTWYVGLDAEATGIGDALWNGEELDRAARERIIGLYRLTVPRRRRSLGQGQGRAHLSDIGDDAGADIAHETAKSRDRAADRAARGGVVSVPAHARIAVGVVVERRKAKSAWIDFTWTPVTVLAGVPDAAPWTMLSEDGEGATFYAGAAEIALYRTETTNYRDNLATGGPGLWVALRPTGVEPPYEIFAVTADPAEGEAWTEVGRRCRGRRADAGRGARGDRRLRRRAPCRAAVLQAQARPRRSGGAGAPRAGGEGSARMSEPENFIARWSRRKRAAAERADENTPETPSANTSDGDENVRRAQTARDDPSQRRPPSCRSISPSCRRSNRSPPRATSAPSSHPAYRQS